MELDQSNQMDQKWKVKSQKNTNCRQNIIENLSTQRMVLARWVKSVQASLCVPPGIFGPGPFFGVRFRTFFRHCERSPTRQDPARLEVLVSIVFASMFLQPVQVAAGLTRSSAENSLIHDGVLQCPSLLHQLVHHFLFFRMFMVLLFHKGTGMDFHNNHRESLQQIGILLLRQIESLKHGQETRSVYRKWRIYLQSMTIILIRMMIKQRGYSLPYFQTNPNLGKNIKRITTNPVRLEFHI